MMEHMNQWFYVHPSVMGTGLCSKLLIGLTCDGLAAIRVNDSHLPAPQKLEISNGRPYESPGLEEELN